MAKSVYYYQLGAGRKADPYREVKESIKTIYHRHKGRYGYRRVQEELGHQNCYLNPIRALKARQRPIYWSVSSAQLNPIKSG